mmetsp:Transcript_40464/g.95844  ORF Transcript_40464/g.95844 Transcript_40464/m.95844 type:complete len:219 (+) Transcript_40464:44-700(+)
MPRARTSCRPARRPSATILPFTGTMRLPRPQLASGAPTKKRPGPAPTMKTLPHRATRRPRRTGRRARTRARWRECTQGRSPGSTRAPPTSRCSSRSKASLPTSTSRSRTRPRSSGCHPRPSRPRPAPSASPAGRTAAPDPLPTRTAAAELLPRRACRDRALEPLPDLPLPPPRPAAGPQVPKRARPTPFPGRALEPLDQSALLLRRAPRSANGSNGRP